ncbi:MAG: pantetheine-phosphate adenylyltransferase [Clostridia bacterium]|nr:pantetheine-phosphate adenylyltransferase [Clostridia bacterium]
MATTVVCPGSFDPITMGHLDIITRASKMFDNVIVLVSCNTAKTPLFSAEERMEMIKKSTANLKNVTVDSDDGLLADYMRKVDACAIVKGLRAVSDFEYEFQMALTNKKLNSNADTVFLTAGAENMYLSSSIVKSVGKLGGDIKNFVPDVIYDDICTRLKSC